MKKKVILITDGDEYANYAIKYVANKVGGQCISQSAGNPTTLSGAEIVQLVMKTVGDPVFIMFDDSGQTGEGSGEKALKYVANHPKIQVLGVIAVASKTRCTEWARMDLSIDREGNITEYGVDKEGIPELEVGRIYGDTVYVLDELDVPVIVGIGDIGKMGKHDSVENGCPITRKAVEIILERSGYYDNDIFIHPCK